MNLYKELELEDKGFDFSIISEGMYKLPHHYKVSKYKGKERRVAVSNYYTEDEELIKFFSESYCGEGFYVNHKTKVVDFKNHHLIRTWGYDRHSCYLGEQIYRKYPLSYKRSDTPTELGIYTLKIKSIEPRYEDFNYTLYLNRIDKDTFIIKLTNIDLPIFNDMYIVEYDIIDTYWFAEIGYLPEDYKEFLKELYRIRLEKKANKDDDLAEYKTTLEALTGMFANTKKSDRTDSFFKNTRNCRCIVAMFVTAYGRLTEHINFKKYMDKVIYMNTDSIYCTEPIDIPTGDGLGEYALEYDGNEIFYICRNRYIVLDKEGDILKQVVGGINGQLTFKQIIDLMHPRLDTNMKEVEVYGYNKIINEEGELVRQNIRITPWFILNNVKENNNGKM